MGKETQERVVKYQRKNGILGVEVLGEGGPFGRSHVFVGSVELRVSIAHSEELNGKNDNEPQPALLHIHSLDDSND